MNIVEIIKIIGVVLGAMLGLAGFAALLGVAYSQFKKSGRQETSEVLKSADGAVDFWKNQANDYKEMMAAKDLKSNEQINALTEKVGILTGQLRSEKEQNDRLEKIMQGRNPEMETFMKYMVTSSEKHSETHTAMMKVLTDLHTMSASNHQLLKQEGEKDLKIDATITKK